MCTYVSIIIILQEAIRKQKEREERIRREFERRMNPKTKEDFDLLYHTLESEFHNNCTSSMHCY